VHRQPHWLSFQGRRHAAGVLPRVKNWVGEIHPPSLPSSASHLTVYFSLLLSLLFLPFPLFIDLPPLLSVSRDPTLEACSYRGSWGALWGPLKQRVSAEPGGQTVNLGAFWDETYASGAILLDHRVGTFLTKSGDNDVERGLVLGGHCFDSPGRVRQTVAVFLYSRILPKPSLMLKHWHWRHK